MSDIGISTTAYQVDNRSWLLSQFGQGPGENPNIVIDFSLFDQATHYPNGFLKSGERLAKVTATNVWGPYDTAATDGRQSADIAGRPNVGLLHSPVSKPKSGNRSGGALVVAGFVKESKLPRALDTAFRAALRLCHFTA